MLKSLSKAEAVTSASKETALCNQVLLSKEKNQRENGTVNSSIQFSNGFQIEFPHQEPHYVIGLECATANEVPVPLHSKEVDYGLKAHHANHHLAPPFYVQNPGYGDSSEGSIDQFSQENRDTSMLSQGETYSHSQQHFQTDTQMTRSSFKPSEYVKNDRFRVMTDLKGLKDDARKTCARHLQSGTSVSSDDHVIPRPKKLKGNDPLGLLPWHIEVSNGSCRLQTVSLAETEWALASKRLSEKMEEEAGTNQDVTTPISRAKKRLKLTTQLLQQVIRPAPARIFSGDVRLNSGSMAFFVCRLALGDACSLTRDSHLDPVTNNKPLKKFRTSSSISKQEDLLKTIENFNQRAKRIESDLLRLENLSSITETKVEIRDQERFSIITRLVKFHSRGNVVSGNAPSDSGAAQALLKPNLVRYVVAHPMPSIVPEETKCLSL